MGNHLRTPEAKCIRELIEANLYHGWISVGIITPYVNQRNLLSESMHRLMKKHGITEDMDDDIVTVHGSQGREWDVVIFSVSRARKTLILVGDAAEWKRRPGQLLSELFEIAEPAGKDLGSEW